MEKKLKKMLSIVLALTLVLGGTSVFASEKSKNTSGELSEVENSLNKINDIAQNSIEVNDAQKILEIKSIVKDSLEKNLIIPNFEDGSLVFEEAKLLDIREENDIYTSITVPVKGNKYSTISNMTFVLCENQIITYTETLITKSENNKFVIDTYFDGSLIESNHTDIDYISNSEIQQGLDSIQDNSKMGNSSVQTRGGAEIAGCLAVVLGVNITVALLIAGTCVASCPAVVPICVACITGVCVLGGADVAAAVGCFGL